MAGSNSADERDGLRLWTAANVVTKHLRIAVKARSSISCFGLGRRAKDPHYKKTLCLKMLRLIIYCAALIGIQTFRDGPSVPSSRVKQSKKTFEDGSDWLCRNVGN